jgi:hypothetical protein
MTRGIVDFFIHAQSDRHVGLGRRSGDDDLARAGLDVLRRVGLLPEKAGGLDHDLAAELAPGKIGGIAFRQDAHLARADTKAAGGAFHRLRKLAVHRVILEQVRQGLGVGDVIDSDELELAIVGPDAHHAAADPAEAVDTHTRCHSTLLCARRVAAPEMSVN